VLGVGVYVQGFVEVAVCNNVLVNVASVVKTSVLEFVGIGVSVEVSAGDRDGTWVATGETVHVDV
jgi:hypothetical protein